MSSVRWFLVSPVPAVSCSLQPTDHFYNHLRQFNFYWNILVYLRLKTDTVCEICCLWDTKWWSKFRNANVLNVFCLSFLLIL
jgi:hypothetical protein